VDLIVQAAWRIFGRARVFVLHEGNVPADSSLKFRLGEALEEKFPFVTKYLGLKQDHVENSKRCDLH
jgi:hypothetical protein